MRLIKLIWYYSFWLFVRLALMVYYKEIKLSGKENIPKDVPIIFGANHENSLIDPLIMTTRFPLMIHYLVRADVFKNPIVSRFLQSLNLMPVYRMSDGVNSIKANEEIFNNCFRAFAKKESLILFPEATHDDRRIVKKAKKGIGRIAIGAMNQEDASDELYIVPIGMNYSAHRQFRSSVHIVFGQPIKIEKQEITNENIDAIRKTYDHGLAESCVSIPRDEFELYNSIFFHDQSPKRILDPVDINTQVAEIEQYITTDQKEELIEQSRALSKAGVILPFEKRDNYWLNAFIAALISPIALFGAIVHAPAILVSSTLMKNFKDKVWTDTIYFGVGLLLVPISWMIVGVLSYLFLGGIYAAAIAVFISYLSLLLMKLAKRNWKLFIDNRKLANSPQLKEKYDKFIALVKQFRV